MVSLNLIKFLLILTLLNSKVKSENMKNKNKIIEREKRVVGLFPYNSCTGVRNKFNVETKFLKLFYEQILVTISVPLKNVDRNVFCAYNFEANYNMPLNTTDVIPGPLNRVSRFYFNLKIFF